MKLHIFLVIGILLILGILSVCSWVTYGYYQMVHADDPVTPSVSALEGGVTVIRGDSAIELSKGESYDLEVNDAVETDKESLGMITWPDHSITRLGSESRIVIREMLAEDGYQKIQVSFSLERGKIWSTVLRSLIGDSYFATHLPKNDIVAGVRGTTYEINLDKQYIHAIHHAISLKDTSKKTLLLMPGDIVQSDNIWIRRGKEILDTAWTELNTTYDTVYLRERARSLQSGLDRQKNILMKSLDTGVRFLLKYFKTFETLWIEDLIKDGNIQALSNLSPDTLVKYYQRIQGGINLHDTDTIRSVLYEKISSSGSGMDDILKSLTMSSFWESMDTGKMLPGTEKLLKASNIDIGNDIENLRNILQNQDFTQQIRNSVRTWME